MSSDIAIKVDNLSKCYHIYDKPRHRLLQMVTGSKKQFYREFWALNDVSFEVAKGETVGIVGHNGSGKSTLLQLICGVLTPTNGSVETNGRVAALLELGSGFNPEFTGRENVYLNGEILGMSREEIDQRFDDIVGFADIGDFIDQPVKHYSSGMMVRLAFSVAINVEPKVLIVDEALSVGDELFQRKCFSRIESIKEKGATVIFVSHSGSLVVELCDKALLLDAGELLAKGSPKTIVGEYQRLLYASDEKRFEIRQEIKANKIYENVSLKYVSTKREENRISDELHEIEEFYEPSLEVNSTISYESNGAKIHSPEILTLDNKPVNCLKKNKEYRYRYIVDFDKDAEKIRCGMLIKTISGVELGGAVSSKNYNDSLAYISSGRSLIVEFRFRCMLNSGAYFLNAGVLGFRDGEEIYLHRMLDTYMFRVLPENNVLQTGIVDFNCVPKLSLQSDRLGK